jgi:predicted TPR repeat methyltransferase
MTPTATVLAQALQQHQTGNLSAAEALYRRVLGAEPRNVNALYLLATVCQAQGRVSESVDLYRQCLQIKPDIAEVHNALGGAHASQGRLTEALACYRQAVRLKPDYAEALNNLGYVQTTQGEWDQGLTSLGRALTLKPHYPEALSNLGIVHFQQHRVDEAVQCFRQALALRPAYPEALNNLGNALLAQGKPAEAGDCYRHVLRLRPNDARASNNLAGVYQRLQQWDEAVACLQNSLALNPNDPATHRNLGKIYQERGNHVEALRCMERVLALCPDDVEARFVLDAARGASLSRVPADYVAALYDASADLFEREMERIGYRGPEWLRAALGPAPAPRSLVILDMGCGTGRIGMHFRDWAQTLIGVDLSAQMLARARQRGIYDELIQSDLLPLVQASSEKFDLILAAEVLLFLGDLEPLTRAVHGALRPGGRFAFTAELLEGPDCPPYRLLPVNHFAHSRAYLQALASMTGLQEVCTNPVVLPRGGGQEVAGLVVVLARSPA